jgi:hypothetical protein
MELSPPSEGKKEDKASQADLASNLPGERGNAAAPPFTRSQLCDIRIGLQNGAPLEAIARSLEFSPELVKSMPDIIGFMAGNEDLSPRDRIAASKAYVAFLRMRMEQEQREYERWRDATKEGKEPPPGTNVNILVNGGNQSLPPLTNEELVVVNDLIEHYNRLGSVCENGRGAGNGAPPDSRPLPGLSPDGPDPRVQNA